MSKPDLLVEKSISERFFYNDIQGAIIVCVNQSM